MVPSETDSVSLFSLLKNKTKEERKKKEGGWRFGWMPISRCIYYGRARVSSSNAHKLFGSASCCCHKVESSEGLVHTAPAAMCRLFGRGLKKNVY